jgi:hypothetical protein
MKKRTMRSRSTLLGAGLLAVAASLTVGACASNDEPAASGPTTTGLSSGSTALPVPTTGPIAIARVVDNFEYYGACGNETVEVGRTTFYPVLPRHRSQIDESRYPLDDGSAPAGLTRVAPPGPGDDVGTMIVYTDGMARFESDSGRVIWLTDHEQTYTWVC